MIAFPNAKINIGLNILGKRNDGFHNLQTVFYPVAIKDTVEIIVHQNPLEEVVFSSSGIPVDGTQDDNLCIKAYRLLKRDFPHLPSVKMHLHKNIPMGAGLGGGSADAAFMLQLLNNKFNLQLEQNELIEYSKLLGSDCPFFILNSPCFATGRGEILQKLDFSLSNYKILIINPGIHINTRWAFGELQKNESQDALDELIQLPIAQWKNFISNDFELPIFKKHPEIEVIKNKLYESGAIYAAMSGSGSSVYGIFDPEFKGNINFQETYFYKWV
jgi:4-diphosphocytidyl-2-C-methyl-D-erythritol kinase